MSFATKYLIYEQKSQNRRTVIHVSFSTVIKLGISNYDLKRGCINHKGSDSDREARLIVVTGPNGGGNVVITYRAPCENEICFR